MTIIELFNYKPGHGDKLETRVCGVLLRNQIHTVEELRKLSDTDLLRMRGIGKDSVRFIHQKLKKGKQEA